MEHGNRIKVVRGLHIRILKQYKDAVLFGGVYGSTATGRDTEYSDIEMLYITQAGIPSVKKTFLYRGIPIEFEILEAAAFDRWLDKPDIQLPLKMGNLAGLQLLSGELRQREEILQKYEALPMERIQEFFKERGSEIAYESYNKIRSLASRAARQDLSLYIYEVLHEMSLALALINRKTIQRGYLAGIRESFNFDQIPNDYKDYTEALLKTTVFTDAVETGRKLIASYDEFLRRLEIPVKNLNTLDEIEW